jgi:hypothetical protein
VMTVAPVGAPQRRVARDPGAAGSASFVGKSSISRAGPESAPCMERAGARRRSCVCTLTHSEERVSLRIGRLSDRPMRYGWTPRCGVEHGSVFVEEDPRIAPQPDTLDRLRQQGRPMAAGVIQHCQPEPGPRRLHHADDPTELHAHGHPLDRLHRHHHGFERRLVAVAGWPDSPVVIGDTGLRCRIDSAKAADLAGTLPYVARRLCSRAVRGLRPNRFGNVRGGRGNRCRVQLTLPPGRPVAQGSSSRSSTSPAT